jgi:hypothetical protein
MWPSRASIVPPRLDRNEADMIGTPERIRRGLFGSVSQVVVSVVATLIATAVYPALKQEFVPTQADTAPAAATSGGKFTARIEGAEQPATSTAMPRPTLSIVNWGITPTRSPALIDDVAWEPLRNELSPLVQAPAKLPRAAREPKHATALAANAPPVKNPGVIPQLDLRTVPTVEVMARQDGGLWSTAKAAVQSVASLGGSVLSRVLP